MRYVSACVLLFWVPSLWAGEICATHLDELVQTPQLLSVHALFHGGTDFKMVNETKGSFLVIDSISGSLSIAFYTSGVFDLYPIKREGPVRFCDNDGKLTLVGMDRVEDLRVENGALIVGKGGPRMTFRLGEMPVALMKLHHYGERGIASHK